MAVLQLTSQYFAVALNLCAICIDFFEFVAAAVKKQGVELYAAELFGMG
jgi:hypothetical protein